MAYIRAVASMTRADLAAQLVLALQPFAKRGKLPRRCHPRSGSLRPSQTAARRLPCTCQPSRRCGRTLQSTGIISGNRLACGIRQTGSRTSRRWRVPERTPNRCPQAICPGHPSPKAGSDCHQPPARNGTDPHDPAPRGSN